MYLLVLVVPACGSLLSGLGGRYVGEKGARYGTVICMALCVLLSLTIYAEVIMAQSTTHLQLWKWLETGWLASHMGLQFDTVTAVMLVVVSGISFLVHVYSTRYMAGDPHLPRFMSYLSLFTFMMILLVTADNYIQLFIGWEGVGLCSYLLVNYWYARLKANQAAMKALLVNRVGDIGMVLGILMVVSTFGSTQFDVVGGLVGLQPLSILTPMALCLFVGAIAKSAQLGLHTWLPDAMEGPTPVSALIHAATMVTAGVFLVIRSAPLFTHTPTALMVVIIIGSLTAFFAASVGCAQNDLKKVVAYSTCSQLGYMVMICGLSHYSVSLFHLANHAFFKALLFLSAGSIIHALSDEQDIRKMGGLLRLLPYSYVAMVVGSLALIGFPFLAGFYSKDLILELLAGGPGRAHVFAYWMGGMAAFMTAYYSARSIWLAFITEPQGQLSVWARGHEAPLGIVFPLLVLGIASILVGYLLSQAVVFSCSSTIPPFISGVYKLLPLVLSLMGVLMGGLYGNVLGHPLLYGVYRFLNGAWYFNYVINHFLVYPLLNWSHVVAYRVLDRGLWELMGPTGIGQSIRRGTRATSYYQSGMVYNYILVMAAFLSLFWYAVGRDRYLAG